MVRVQHTKQMKMPLHVFVHDGLEHELGVNGHHSDEEGSTLPTTTACPVQKTKTSGRSLLPPRDRRVHFSNKSSQPDAKEVVDIILIPPKEYIDISRVYYSRDEIFNLWKKAKSHSENVLTKSTPKAQEGFVARGLDQLFEAAPNKPCYDSCKELAGLYKSSARGLEHLLSDQLKQHRKAAIDRILQAQILSQDPDQRTSLMRMRSLLASKKARNFAQHLGATDALEVRHF